MLLPLVPSLSGNLPEGKDFRLILQVLDGIFPVRKNKRRQFVCAILSLNKTRTFIHKLFMGTVFLLCPFFFPYFLKKVRQKLLITLVL